MTSSTGHDLSECQNKIKQLAQSYSYKLHLSNKDDVGDWSQDTIGKYYEYCLRKRVIPTLDIQRATLDLVGPKDAVSYSLYATSWNLLSCLRLWKQINTFLN